MLVVVILFMATGIALAQDQPRKGSYIQLEEHDWSLDWTYDFSYPEIMSRENISDTALGTSKIIDHTLDLGIRKLTGGKRGDYMSAMIITGFTTAIMEHSLSVAEHEMGHLQVWSRAGISRNHFRFYDTKNEPHKVDDFLEIWNAVWVDNQGLKGAAVGLDTSGYNELYGNPDLTGHFTEINIMIEAGGLNQIQYSLERINNRIYAGEGHILDGPGWLWRMNNTLMYNTSMENSDIRDYLDDLKLLGIRSNIGHVKNIQWLKYLSGSSLAMYTGVYNFFDHGETKLKPPFLWWPEFASYLTTHGPTLKIRRPIRERGAMLEPSIQFSLDDTKHEEYGLRIEDQLTRWARLNLGGFINRADGHWLDGALTLSPFAWLDLGVGFTYGKGWTYEREINGKTFWFADEDEFSIKGSISIFFRF
ncbi:MAG: hypothetical protein G01um10143_509 [Parcubacteria group bacterium Gr01-1014_3]|nr:MAG: hypothetical protein G01um10143_509 [Parcubacteria group bacterium Gr01-1014_3]